MKKHKVILQNKAQLDAKGARRWYELQQKGLGKRFGADLKITLKSIAENPDYFSTRYSNTRKANLKTFPYGVFFFRNHADGVVYVTAIAHNSMDSEEY